MQLLRALSIVIPIMLLVSCGLLQHEEDEDVLNVARQLLDAQKDQYGDPLPVKLPIRINYTITRKPIIDQDMPITLEFIAEKEIPLLRIGMTTSDGLELDSSDVRERYHDLQPRQTFIKHVTVIPHEENEYYLNLFVVTEIGEERLAKLIKIPIAIGDFSLPKKSAGPST